MTTLEAALKYALRGWRVVPIMPGDKRPALNAWQDLATTNAETITQWFSEQYKGHGVGIATGEASGIWVLDVDDRDSLHDLEATHGKLPQTLTSITGSGGEHQVYRWPADGRTIRNSASGILPGLDVRGEGGQIVRIEVEGRAYAGGWWDWLSPFSILTGVSVVMSPTHLPSRSWSQRILDS